MLLHFEWVKIGNYFKIGILSGNNELMTKKLEAEHTDCRTACKKMNSYQSNHSTALSYAEDLFVCLELGLNVC